MKTRNTSPHPAANGVPSTAGWDYTSVPERSTSMAGYILSNLEIYSYYRNMEYDGVKFSDYYPRRKGLQGGFVTISYNF